MNELVTGFVLGMCALGAFLITATLCEMAGIHGLLAALLCGCSIVAVYATWIGNAPMEKE